MWQVLRLLDKPPNPSVRKKNYSPLKGGVKVLRLKKAPLSGAAVFLSLANLNLYDLLEMHLFLPRSSSCSLCFFVCPPQADLVAQSNRNPLTFIINRFDERHQFVKRIKIALLL